MLFLFAMGFSPRFATASAPHSTRREPQSILRKGSVARRGQKAGGRAVKFLGRLALHPVAGALDGCDPGARKGPADERDVLLGDVVGAPAADKTRGLVEGRLDRDSLDQRVVIFRDRAKTDAPAETAGLVAAQIFKQKLPERGVGNCHLERRVGIGEA